MDTLQELVGPEFNRGQWAPAPVAFTCYSCGKMQKSGAWISHVCTPAGDLWPADCRRCEEICLIGHALGVARGMCETSKFSQEDFNEYTRESWEEWAARPVPVAFEKLLVWIAERDALMRFQEKLAKLPEPAEGSEYYHTSAGDLYEKRERVDWWKAMSVPGLPEKPQLRLSDRIDLEAVRQVKPDHPIVIWLG